MSEWQPIETAPKDGTPVFIAWAGTNFHPMVAHAEDGVWGYLMPDLAFYHASRPPTHWMPLPPPPTIK
jgi:hypothetical protein